MSAPRTAAGRVLVHLVTLGVAAVCASGAAPPPAGAELLHAWTSRLWYSDTLSGAAVTTTSGRFLVYSNEGEVLVRDLAAGATFDLGERVGISVALWFPEPAGDRLEFKGRDAGGSLGRHVVDLRTGALGPSTTPRNMLQVSHSADGSVRAGFEFRRLGAGLEIEDLDAGTSRTVAHSPPPLGLALSPDGRRLAWLVQAESGWGELYLYDAAEARTELVADDLDIAYPPTPIAFDAGGGHVLLSLVGARRGRPADRHLPHPERDLDIWAVSVEDGSRRRVVEMPGDDLVSGVRDGGLVWTNRTTVMRTVVVDAAGGATRALTGPTTAFPHWRPDGRRLSVMDGGWRLADWALDWDVFAVDVDADARPAGPPVPLVQGFHEDFDAAWSPDGKWLAYHSHRSATPVASYAAEGSTDAIWLRAAEGGPERKLSGEGHFETLQAEWSPDGTQLLFCSLGQGRPYRPTLLTIDPETGEPTGERLLDLPAIEGHVLGAAWSPTRPFEIFLEVDDGSGNRALWRTTVNGDAPRRLVEFRSLAEFGGLSVGPDGETVYYAALVDGHHQLHAIGRDGGSPRQLTREAEEVIAPQVSPDGRIVAATQYRHDKRVFRMPWTP